MDTEGITKLQTDLHILEVMAENVGGYLRSNALFGKTPGRMPELTLGSYLMRQYRLVELAPLLTDVEKSRLETAMSQFKAVMDENIVRSEQKAHREFKSRLKQWEEYIRDLRRDTKSHFYYYSTAVAPRAMLQELYNMLSTYPYRLEEDLPARLVLLDGGLRGIWDMGGEFIWPEEWQDAYPPEKFWWLYGQPSELRQE